MLHDRHSRGYVGQPAAVHPEEEFHTIDVLYRRERNFIFQPQRVVLDELFIRLRSTARELAERARRSDSDVEEIDHALSEQTRAAVDFMKRVTEAVNIISLAN